jgi:hypothetical protein
MPYRVLTPEEERAEEKRRQEENNARYERRQEFLAELLGPAGVTRYAPPPVSDFDAQLGEHAAQIAKLTRLALNYALNDDWNFDNRIDAANTITRLIQTNVAIARVLRAQSKTVQGVQQDRETQAMGSRD